MDLLYKSIILKFQIREMVGNQAGGFQCCEADAGDDTYLTGIRQDKGTFAMVQGDGLSFGLLHLGGGVAFLDGHAVGPEKADVKIKLLNHLPGLAADDCLSGRFDDAADQADVESALGQLQDKGMLLVT